MQESVAQGLELEVEACSVAPQGSVVVTAAERFFQVFRIPREVLRTTPMKRVEARVFPYIQNRSTYNSKVWLIIFAMEVCTLLLKEERKIMIVYINNSLNINHFILKSKKLTSLSSNKIKNKTIKIYDIS